MSLIPYGEKIVSDHVRTHPDIVELEARVVGKTPSSIVTPWIRVTQLDGRAVGGHRADHLIEFYFQFDCYAGADKDDELVRETSGQPEANLLARTVRAALVAMPETSHDGAVVTGVDIRSMARIPDNDLEPSRERFIITALIWMHG